MTEPMQCYMLTGHILLEMQSRFIIFGMVECIKELILVYVIAWVAVVFGINCASNVGRKLAAEHYYCFQPTLREQLITNTMASHAITN